ncbi:MAG: DUF4837 family protein [Bacteroidetes bacterium]|nr:DUF4837 family protein [Bacteroidota bacterium]
MKYLKIFFGISLLFLWSCASDTSGSVRPVTQRQQPHSHGKINQILVVADSSLWKGAVGDSFFYYFNAPYILLPQPEPIFDLIHRTPEELTVQTAKKEFRTIIFLADLNDENSSTARLLRADLGAAKLVEVQQGKGYNVTVGQDKWARSQLLFYISGFGEGKLAENIAANFPAIAKKINEKDGETVKANTYQGGENVKLEAEVLAKFGVKMEIPKGYKLAKYDGSTNTLWLRNDDREIIANLLLRKLPYTDKKQLTKVGIKKIRDEVAKIVTTQQPNSYMHINDVDLPLFVENITLNETYTVQARGVWDMVNDFKGGPFISNLMLNPKTNELVLVDGFIFAPGKDKRNYMQEMEMVLSSAQF